MLDRAEARALVLVASIAAIPACAARAGARDETRSASMDGRTERTNADVVRSLYELGLNTGDVVVVEESVAPDFVGPRGDVGPAAFARTLFELRAAFPDLRYTIEDLVAEGDRVALRWTLTGTHAGAFRAFAPTGKKISTTGFGFFQLRGGKVVRAWVETDRLGFLQQIGALPPEVAARLQADAPQRR